MPIPHDPENRWWVEVSGANPDLVDSFRSVIVAIVAFDRDRVPQIIGTGFIVACNPDFALIFSAKHVFQEGVVRVQRPNPINAASALAFFIASPIPSLKPANLRVVLLGRENANVLNTVHVCYNDSLDIACCIVVPQPNESINEQYSIPLDVDVPTIGDVVHLVAMEEMEVEETDPPIAPDGEGQIISLTRKISIRVGVVTGVYPQGYRQYRWPCFTTSIPAEPGMSGGFVYWPREGITIAACGVVCADNSSDEARRDFSLRGESVIACAWPSLSLRMPLTLPPPADGSTHTLFEMVHRGRVPPPLGGIERITLNEAGNGDCSIGKDL